jgi:predicted ABC-class ATPase
MHGAEDLSSELKRLDRRGYKAYKDIAGRWDFSNFQLHIDHVQGDPFASPSRLRVRIPMQIADFPDSTYHNRSRLYATRGGGSGKSGSGSISQAANIIEAIEAGASSLLIDEDTSAALNRLRSFQVRQV